MLNQKGCKVRVLFNRRVYSSSLENLSDGLNKSGPVNSIEYYQELIDHYLIRPTYGIKVEFARVIPFRNKFHFKTKDASGLEYIASSVEQAESFKRLVEKLEIADSIEVG